MTKVACRQNPVTKVERPNSTRSALNKGMQQLNRGREFQKWMALSCWQLPGML